HVPFVRWPPLETTEQRGCGRVPREQVEPRPDDEGRQRLDGVEQTEQPRPNILERGDLVRRGGPAGEGEEMRSLIDVALEGAGQGAECGVGGTDLAPFQPLDVVDADGGQRGHLFASKSLDPPAAARSEPDVLGSDPGPP